MNTKIIDKFEQFRLEIVHDITDLVKSQPGQAIILGDDCYQTLVPVSNEVVITEQYKKLYFNPAKNLVMLDYVCCEGFFTEGPDPQEYTDPIDILSMDTLFEVVKSLPESSKKE